MITKHTPGPWIVDGSRIAAPDGTTVINCLGAMGGHDTQADARLIAAAPDLLAALEAAEGVVDWALSNDAHPGVRAVHRMVLDALAKAKGEA